MKMMLFRDFKEMSFFSSRRTIIEPTLTYTRHYVYEQEFQRYNLAKFPCTLKRLEMSFDKLVEICTTNPGKRRFLLIIPIFFLFAYRRR